MNNITERAPLLSDGQAAPTREDLGFDFDIDDPNVDIDAVHTRLASSFSLWFYGHIQSWHPEEIAEAAIRWAITSGELMVVKTVKGLMTNGDAWRRCSGCNIEYSPSSRWNFCPGCGARVAKAIVAESPEAGGRGLAAESAVPVPGHSPNSSPS
jgi:hypothetical protein